MKLPERINHLSVSAFGEEAGELSQPSHFEFNYINNNPVSITMAYRTTPYNHGALHPIFSQNLPEGYVRRYISEKLRRYAHINDMYLLALQMDKGIGHLAYKSDIAKQNAEQLSLHEILTWKGDKSLFHELLDRYYLNGLVSGVQPKVLINAKDDTSTQSRSLYQQNEYIVKTFDDEFPLLTVNEFICMECARACGLAPANCWLSEDLQTFVTERFDKPKGVALGIEDFTVLMGKSGDEKYQSSYESLLKATKLYTHSQNEVARMFRYIVFNCLIGNGDAHLKNFALQYHKDRQSLTLTPPYDITHTLIYETIDNHMALKMSGAKSFPDQNELIKLGAAYGVENSKPIIEEFADLILNYINRSCEIELMPGLKASITKAIDRATSISASPKSYRHDKKRKYE